MGMVTSSTNRRTEPTAATLAACLAEGGRVPWGPHAGRRWFSKSLCSSLPLVRGLLPAPPTLHLLVGARSSWYFESRRCLRRE